MKASFRYECAALALAGLLAGGCVHQVRVVDRVPPAEVGTEVTVSAAPPLPEVETMTVSPGPGFVWVPGAWDWRTQWVWVRGHWAHPPEAGAIWVSPRYENRGDKKVFIRGGWRD